MEIIYIIFDLKTMYNPSILRKRTERRKKRRKGGRVKEDKKKRKKERIKEESREEKEGWRVREYAPFKFYETQDLI